MSNSGLNGIKEVPHLPDITANTWLYSVCLFTQAPQIGNGVSWDAWIHRKKTWTGDSNDAPVIFIFLFLVCLFVLPECSFFFIGEFQLESKNPDKLISCNSCKCSPTTATRALFFSTFHRRRSGFACSWQVHLSVVIKSLCLLEIYSFNSGCIWYFNTDFQLEIDHILTFIWLFMLFLCCTTSSIPSVQHTSGLRWSKDCFNKSLNFACMNLLLTVLNTFQFTALWQYFLITLSYFLKLITATTKTVAQPAKTRLIIFPFSKC